MATICTNFLTGNDTTGDGSPALPYKTINKALSVAANNDLVKVAGGQFVKVAGTVTTTARGTTMSTSVDMTGTISVNDVIAIDTSAVDGFDKEHTLFSVIAINATTITVTGQPVQFPPGTYDIYDVNTYHYSTSSTTAQETITTFTATDVTVSGGWSADFTTQNGWTVARKTGGAGGRLLNHNTILKPNVVFEKFIMSQTAFSEGSNNGSFGFDNLSFVFTNTTFGTSNYGMYNPTGRPATYITNATGTSVLWNGGGNRPATLLLNQIITQDLSNSPIKFGYNLSQGASTGPTVRTNNLKVRTSGSAIGMGNSLILGSNNGIGDVFIDSIDLYVNQNAIIPIFSNTYDNLSWRFIGNINVFTDNTRAGITAVQTGNQNGDLSRQIPFPMNRTSGTIDSLPWRTPQFTSESVSFVKGLDQAIYGFDSEGQKVINQDGFVKFADPTTFVTGSNSLRTKINIWNSGGASNRILLGNIAKPTSTFTINIRMKANRTLPTTNSSLSLFYGPAQTSVFTLTSSPSLTTSWQVFSIVVNPSTYPNWNLGNTGLMSVFYNYDQSQYAITDNDYIWIDSITIS